MLHFLAYKNQHGKPMLKIYMCVCVYRPGAHALFLSLETIKII